MAAIWKLERSVGKAAEVRLKQKRSIGHQNNQNHARFPCPVKRRQGPVAETHCK